METENKYYIYLVSSKYFIEKNIGKIGCTNDPYERIRGYRTHIPPIDEYIMNYYLIYELNIKSEKDMKKCEEKIHDYFLKYRMRREINNDSEWFDFKTNNIVETIKNFMKTQTYVNCEVELEEIERKKSKYLQKPFYKNLNFENEKEEKNKKLEIIQKPVIEKIKEFVFELIDDAGYIISPCGSGKTKMTCEGIKGLKRVIICCPFNQIQQQWKKELISNKIFENEKIYLIGSEGTTDNKEIERLLSFDEYVIITTYISSDLLTDLITNKIQLLVCDECHHLTGKVQIEDNGEGKTRKLMAKAFDLKIKRLSLTFTPRVLNNFDDLEVSEIDSDTEYKIKFMSMSMKNEIENEKIFGKNIAEIKLRTMINLGILPDYKIWSLRDELNKGRGIKGKSEYIIDAMNAVEFRDDKEKYILNHLIVFAQTNKDTKEYEKYFKETIEDVLIIRVEGGENVNLKIREFQMAHRAILINCKVLGEGVDIPIADSVAIMYSKKSKTEITQMVLRAGRWYKNKSVFHILIPSTGDEDYSSLESVLKSLASVDEKIYDEIIYKSIKKVSGDKKEIIIEEGGTNERIMIELFEGSDIEQINNCFKKIRNKLIGKSSKEIQELCLKNKIQTSFEYEEFQKENIDLPCDPRFKNITWFDYLNPFIEKIDVKYFVNEILEKNEIKIASDYDKWFQTNSNKKIPSLQNINDGYFGNTLTTIISLSERYGTKFIILRRR